jgi:hypothetical protein
VPSKKPIIKGIIAQFRDFGIFKKHVKEMKFNLA